jgi:ATP-dependent RNA helicase DeaD
MAKEQSGFATLGLSDGILAAIAALGYEEPTPVQSETIPLLLKGRDLLAQAATGTGKTAAFALPMLQRIVEAGATGRHPTAGLVLVPTRELAMQVAEAVHKYARGGAVSVVPLFGGASMHQQIRSLERGANVVVATPGRALDHIRRQTLKLDLLNVLVLDRPTKCWTWASPRISTPSSTRRRRIARRRCSRRRCRRGSCRLPSGT